MADAPIPGRTLFPASCMDHLFDHWPDPLYVTDCDGRIRRFNAAGSQALSVAPAALPDEPWFRLICADDQEYTRAVFIEAVATGEARTVTARCRQSDGAQRWIEWRLIADAKQGVVYALGRDCTAQRLAEDRLRMFEAMVEQAAIGMAITDIEGRITYANAAMRATYGYGEATVGMCVPQLVIPDERADPAANMARLVATGCATNEATFRCHDNTLRPVEVAALLIRGADGAPQATAAIIRDLTDERARERRLRIFETLVENTPDGISVNGLDGRLIYTNPAFRTQIGLTGPVGELTMGQVVDPAEMPRMHAEVWPRVAAGGSWRGRTRLRRLDGSTFPTESLTYAIRDEQGQIQAFAGVMHDVTEQERAEHELRLAKFTLERTPDGTYWGDPTGAIIYANEGATATLGYSREELQGMSIQDIDPAFPARSWETDVWAPLKKHGVLSFEATHRRKDGALVPVDVVAYYLEFEGREYGCSFARDISERKRAEDERAALQGQVIAAQQAALRELSTPLIPIADGVVVMPLIGALDSARAQQVLETLLEGVAERQAHVAILDITGVAVVDTQVANALLRAAQAVRLLGARVVLTGIRPEVAQTLVHLGADMSGITTRGSLQSGIAYALGQR